MVWFYCQAAVNEINLKSTPDKPVIKACLAILKTDKYIDTYVDFNSNQKMVVINESGITFISRGGYLGDLKILDPKNTSNPPNNTPIKKSVNWGNVWAFIGVLLTALAIIISLC